MRQDLPTFEQGSRPSRHQRCTVTGPTPMYLATSPTVSNSLSRISLILSPFEGHTTPPQDPLYPAVCRDGVSQRTTMAHFTLLSCTLMYKAVRSWNLGGVASDYREALPKEARSMEE